MIPNAALVYYYITTWLYWQAGIIFSCMAPRTLSPEQMHLVADRFRALGEPTRLQILSALRPRERNVSELVAETGIGQANLSKHLQLLLRLGFVERRKDGLNTYYRLADAEIFQLCDLMCGRVEAEMKAKQLAWAPASRAPARSSPRKRSS